MDHKLTDKTVCIAGLGYVGLPLALAFSRHLPTIGFDVDAGKIRELSQANDNPNIAFTDSPEEIGNADFIIIAVPTPVTKSKDPDLSYIESAARTIGTHLKRGAIVVLESTVYPGVTEDVLKPILEHESGLTCGTAFKIGYSPERINPGDDEHSLERITKIVSGMDSETTEALSSLYGMITTVYEARDIRTAEAAKVIENVQRDLNIALVNELSLIFGKMGLSTADVLEAAGTKWNFHRYSPGLVGGHCIPVDPYYLVHRAEELGYHPQVILAGRAINDSMPAHVAGMMIRGLNEAGKVIKGSKVLIMGLAYKENVADIRESPARGIVEGLREFGVEVYGWDPLLKREEIEGFGVRALDDLLQITDYCPKGVDGVIVTVVHDEFRGMGLEDLRGFMDEGAVVVDVRGCLMLGWWKGWGFIIGGCECPC
ncbi:MAG: nucleotide sugar dehydrogenase [Methanosarcinaceae archaeon]